MVDDQTNNYFSDKFVGFSDENLAKCDAIKRRVWNSDDDMQRWGVSYSAENGHSEIIKLMMEAGAVHSFVNDEQRTPLILSA